MGQPRGEGKAVGIGIELIPAQVIAHTDSPGGQELIAITRGEIELLLPIAVVHGQVGGVAVEIMGAVISILGQHLSGEAVAKSLSAVGAGGRRWCRTVARHAATLFTIAPGMPRP